MAYDREKIEQQLLDVIESDNHITTFEDAASHVEPSRQTLYNWDFDKLDSLKSAIAENKTTVKRNLRKQWATENASATLQLALYKLLSTENELKALSMEYRHHSGAIDTDPPSNLQELYDEERHTESES